MNQQGCFYEIKKEITFACSNNEKTKLNLKIDSHGKNIILYAKAGTTWENTSTWITDPLRITGSAKNFVGNYSFEITDSLDTIVLGAIPFTTQSLKDVSADFSIQYWAECVIDETVVVEEATIEAPPKNVILEEGATTPDDETMEEA